MLVAPPVACFGFCLNPLLSGVPTGSVWLTTHVNYLEVWSYMPFGASVCFSFSTARLLDGWDKHQEKKRRTLASWRPSVRALARKKRLRFWEPEAQRGRAALMFGHLLAEGTSESPGRPPGDFCLCHLRWGLVEWHQGKG